LADGRIVFHKLPKAQKVLRRAGN